MPRRRGMTLQIEPIGIVESSGDACSVCGRSVGFLVFGDGFFLGRCRSRRGRGGLFKNRLERVFLAVFAREFRLRTLGVVEFVEALRLRLGERIVEDVLEACVERESAVVFRQSLDVAVVGLEEESLRLEECA